MTIFSAWLRTHNLCQWINRFYRNIPHKMWFCDFAFWHYCHFSMLTFVFIFSHYYYIWHYFLMLYLMLFFYVIFLWYFWPYCPKVTCLDFVPQSGCMVVAFEGCWFFDLTFWRYFSMLFFSVTFLHSYFFMLFFDVNFYRYFFTLSTYLMLFFFYFIVWFYCLMLLFDVIFDVTFLC